MKKWAKPLEWIGRLLTLIALVWVVSLIWRQRHVLLSVWSLENGIYLLVILVVYSCSLLLMSLAWIIYLPTKPRNSLFFPLLKMYARTSLAKYLPGNVFHFVGRQVAAAWPNLNHLILARATIMENLSLLSASGMLVLLSWIIHSASLSGMLMMMGIVTAGLVLPVLLYRVIKRYRPELFPERVSSGQIYRILFYPFFIHVAFFAVSGSLFFATSFLLNDAMHAPFTWWLVFPVYVTSWLVGFVTPGSPGGIGVRDALLIVGMTPLIGETAALQSSLIFRVVTISGDLLFAGIVMPIKSYAVTVPDQRDQ
ncbi:MAG TPA: hypothetical protein PJ991_07690 [Kiritimatiellia bacterium]|nr:hypothetical protein [Kiritimatiellia bacterium]